MTQLPDLIAFLVRPALMIAVGAVAYRVGKCFASKQVAARVAFIGTSALFALELASISYLNLRLASAFATVFGIAVLGLIFRKRAFHG